MDEKKACSFLINQSDKERFDKLRKERGVLTHERFKQLLDVYEKSQNNQNN